MFRFGLRRMIAAMLLVLGLAVAMVAPVAAQGASTNDIDVVGIYPLKIGEDRSYFVVSTAERTLSMGQADQLCRDLTFNDAIGIERYRLQGVRYTDVICVADGELLT